MSRHRFLSAGEPIRIARRGVRLLCSALDGQVRRRAVVEQTLRPVAAGTPGTVAFLGNSLAWFGNEPPFRSDLSLPLDSRL